MIHEIEQNTEEWFQLRMGKITASNFASIMANLGKPFGKPALQYAMRVAIESRTNVAIETYSNEWMERGKLLEDDARTMYEQLNFCDVFPGGFAEQGRFGASADGQTEDNGLLEIKSVKYNTHFERLIKGGYDTSYQWQIRGQMWLYDVAWCDFVSYCPDFPVNKQLYVFRVERDAEQEGVMIDRLKEFADKVDEYSKILAS
jgi:putative phage-type endonuclease